MMTRQALSPVGMFGRWDRAPKERDAFVGRPTLADARPQDLFVDVVGHVDLCGPDLVEGWIFWGSQPNRKLQLEVIIGGELIGLCEASLFRPDLQKAGYGDGRCAFSFHVPHAVAARDFASARVRLLNSLLYLLPDRATVLYRANSRGVPSKLTAVVA